MKRKETETSTESNRVVRTGRPSRPFVEFSCVRRSTNNTTNENLVLTRTVEPERFRVAGVGAKNF